MSGTVSILDASKILGVTEKTVRNYIKRGFLTPEKWNGMWQIPEHEVMEICKKKNGKKDQDSTQFQAQEIGVSKSELSQYLLRAGKLEAFETLVLQQRDEIKQLSERIIQLEASSASGWSEARLTQENNESMKKELEARRETEQQLKEELGWLRREKQKIQEGYLEFQERERLLRCKIKDLEDQLYHFAVLGSRA